jgi:hypothetical protein
MDIWSTPEKVEFALAIRNFPAIISMVPECPQIAATICPSKSILSKWDPFSAYKDPNTSSTGRGKMNSTISRGSANREISRPVWTLAARNAEKFAECHAIARRGAATLATAEWMMLTAMVKRAATT